MDDKNEQQPDRQRVRRPDLAVQPADTNGTERTIESPTPPTKPEVTTDAPQVQATAELTDGTPWPFSFPFRAEGAKVVDKDGKTVCVVLIDHLDATARGKVAAKLASLLG